MNAPAGTRSGWRVRWSIETDLGVTTYAECFEDELDADAFAMMKSEQDAVVTIEEGDWPSEAYDERQTLMVELFEDDPDDDDGGES